MKEKYELSDIPSIWKSDMPVRDRLKGKTLKGYAKFCEDTKILFIAFVYAYPTIFLIKLWMVVHV